MERRMDYKTTLNLPTTEFPMKANLTQREPVQVAQWLSQRTYEAMLAQRKASTPFVLHDGPPYANGHIHFGHILNKVLKDIVVKSRAMAGYYTPFIPGWDCHGLPIELAVEQELGGRDAKRPVIETRQACRHYAEKFVAIQRDEFQRLGCFGAWDEPYRTMDFSYQATIAREFANFLESGAVYSGNRPIHWCVSCQTALAETEIEHESHTSPSIYVKFRLNDAAALQQQWQVGALPIFMVIWTTTPWTIPANLAIAMHPELQYVAVEVNGELWVVAEARLAAMMAEIGVTEFTVRATFAASQLAGRVAQHPLLDRESKILLGELVTTEAGSGEVHIAPGHGHDDFEVGRAHGLEPFAPIDNGGKFTSAVGLDWLVGQFVWKANPLIIERLRECGALVASAKIEHQYPHCWRCKNPVVFRVTEQWFVSMAATQLRDQALQAIETVRWVPQWGSNRITGMLANRPDWCISRQRSWGVPIVAVRCASCGGRSTSPAFVRKVADRIAAEGADCWYVHPLEELMPQGFTCAHCQAAGPFEKEYDILDVWFDSGSSFAETVEHRLGIKGPADLYLEGSDQHRGWFHTSLLISIGTRHRAPYRTVFTHGFVVDGQGKKYSKSAKNYVPPEKALNQYGAEVLRLWVAAEDYTNDIRVSDEIMTRLVESYRKIRNTWRFLLGNLGDFDPQRDSVAHAQMDELDRWILHECNQLVARCRRAYEDYQFYQVYQAVNAFCVVQLSARYCDIAKDRLYCDGKGDLGRRATQTAMWFVADTLTRLMAPILSFTAEEVWRYLPGRGVEAGSVFLAALPNEERAWHDEPLASRWQRFWSLREVITKVLEAARAAKAIGNPLDAVVTIECDATTREFLDSFGARLPDLCIVSAIQFGATTGAYRVASDEVAGLSASVAKAQGAKCGRCWKWAPSVGASTQHPELCERCVGVVHGL